MQKLGNTMVDIDKQTVKRLAALCRIACTAEQEEALLHEMQEIIEYVNQLDELDTTGLTECNLVTECLTQTPLRDDVVGDLISRKDFLKNAPDSVAGLIKVNPVR